MVSKKRCSNGCNYPRFSKALCKICWQKEYGKPIKKISANYQKILSEYSPIRKEYLEAHAECELKLECCTRVATCIHHKKSKHSKELYLNSEFYMSSCVPCNGRVEELGEEAYRLGLKVRHNTK